jgi:hypothetical protein
MSRTRTTENQTFLQKRLSTHSKNSEKFKEMNQTNYLLPPLSTPQHLA